MGVCMNPLGFTVRSRNSFCNDSYASFRVSNSTCLDLRMDSCCSHSSAMYEEYDDIVLRMVPLQNAVVRVDVRECPTSRSRKLECRFQGSSAVFHNHTYPLRQNLRAFRLQDILLTALRSRGQASCNTKIVLVRVGPEAVISPAAFLWEPGEIRFSTGRWSASRSPQRVRKRKRSDHVIN